MNWVKKSMKPEISNKTEKQNPEPVQRYFCGKAFQ